MLKPLLIFVDEGINLRLLTNAIGVGRKRIDKAIENGVKNFSISLDSLYPARFDYICEHEGAWDEAVTNISHWSAAHGRLRIHAHDQLCGQQPESRRTTGHGSFCERRRLRHQLSSHRVAAR